jgi:hypothetical protein
MTLTGHDGLDCTKPTDISERMNSKFITMSQILDAYSRCKLTADIYIKLVPLCDRTNSHQQPVREKIMGVPDMDLVMTQI